MAGSPVSDWGVCWACWNVSTAVTAVTFPPFGLCPLSGWTPTV